MKGALSSLKVLDFSTLLPGPFASMMLADMGADVLRIESPTRVDLARVMPPMDGRVSAAHGYLNRGKRSLALDLKQQGATDIIKALVKQYDIVLEQFRPGVMDRLGIGYDDLKAINPGLIYVAITGYGQSGPYRNRAGHDINYLALSGLSSYTGRKDHGPLPLGPQVADVAGGSCHGVIGLLAAVIHRQQTGEGQFVDISMTDTAFTLNTITGASHLVSGEVPAYDTEMLSGGSFYDYYQTSDGRYLSVGSLEPQFAKALCETLGDAGKAALALSPAPASQAQLKGFLAAEIGKRTLAECVELFAPVDACVEPVLDIREAIEHPQLKAREMVIEVPKADGGSQRQMAPPIKFSGAGNVHPRSVGVELGANTDEVLRDIGYSEAQIAEMRANKMVK